MKRHIALTSLMLCFMLAAATDRSHSEMKSIAQRALQTGLRRAKAHATESLGSIQLIKDCEGMAVFGNSDGFAIVSKDNTAMPVLGYALTAFPADDMPCCMKEWMEQMGDALRQAPHTVHLASKAPGANDDDGNYLVKALWDQSNPYNGESPLINGKRTPVGCVATATGEVMKFYEYPSGGTGRGFYTVGESQKEMARILDHPYEWSKMKNTYLGFEKAPELATMLADVGAATMMNYNLDGSGTMLVYAASALATNFQYDSLSLRYYYSPYYSPEEFADAVYSDIRAGRPVLFAASTTRNEGHAFVVDGIDDEGLLHVNWGWSGKGNGYFALTLMDGFTEGQQAIAGITPKTQPCRSEEYSCCGIDGYFDVKDNNVMVHVRTIMNIDYRQFTGVCYVALQDKANPDNVEYFELDSVQLESLYYMYNIDKITNSIGYAHMNLESEYEYTIPAGKYNLYFCSQSEAEARTDSYSIARSEGGILITELTVAADGTKTMKTVGNSADAVEAVITDNGRNPRNSAASFTYNLTGQRVAPNTKGFTIRNGRKVFVR